MSPAPKELGRDYIPELDGFRGLGVLGVLWTHLPDSAFGPMVAGWRHKFTPGEFALDLFFVLSGFLITRILIAERQRGVPLRYFLFRRLLRIFPVYFITIFVLFPRLTTHELVTCLTYTSNYGFMALDHQGPLEQTWSLAVEEQFYLVWPPIIVFCGLAVARRVIWFGFLPLSLLTVFLAYAYGPWDEQAGMMREFVTRSSTSRFLSLGLGALIAFHEVRVRTSKRLSLALIAGGLFVGWAFTFGGVHKLGIEPWLRSVATIEPDYFNRVIAGLQVYSLPGFSLAFLVGAITWTGTWAPQAVLFRMLPLRWIGRISYGIYIYHLGIFQAFGVLGVNRYDPSPAHTAAAIGLTILLSMASFWLLENPLLQFGKRFRHRRQSKPAPAETANEPNRITPGAS